VKTPLSFEDMSVFQRVALIVVGLGLWTTAAAAPPETYPLAKVQPGQTGYGTSTFSGTKPERYTFEVISVVHNMLPKQDIILFRSSDPKLVATGVWRGMSGSPLYIDDKLVCAVSYAWPFSKITMGGCTPVDYMKRDGETFRRRVPIANGPNGTKIIGGVAASMDDWRRLTPKVDVAAAMAALGPAHKSWLLAAPLPPKHVPGAVQHDGQAMTASVPLAVAGFSGPAFRDLGAIFADTGLEPMRAGGTAGPSLENAPRQFTPGGPIAVELVRGDMAMAGTGTVTMIDGNKVLAFGHPMWGNGEWYAPVATSHIHHVLNSMQSASVIASPLLEVGSLVQDRQASILADTSLRSPMIPMDITITTAQGKQVTKGEFHVQLLDNKFLTAAVAGAIVQNAIGYYLPDKEDITARIDSTVRIRGADPIAFTDYVYANDGAGSVMGSVRGLRVLVPLLMNPYSPVKIERIDVKVDLRYEVNFGEIREIRVPTAELIPGQRNLVEVRMTTYDGKDIYEQVPVDVPANLAGSIVQVEITAGDSAKLDAAPPVDLPSLLAAFRKLLPGNVWAVTIYPADEGVALDGKLVRDLPASAQDKLRPQSRTQRAAAYKPIARTVATATRVVEGTSSLLVRVRAAK
jgi:hypothetical protein